MKKYKLQKKQKVLAAIGLPLALLQMVVVTSTIKSIGSNSFNKDAKDEKYIDSTNDEELFIEYSNEKKSVIADKNSTKISLNKNSYYEFIREINDNEQSFSKSEFYELDECLNVYNNTIHSLDLDTSLLDSFGKIDSDLLYQKVLSNNELYKQGPRNSVNTFFSDANANEIKEICNLVAEICNLSNDYDMNKISNALSHLKIFENKTSSSNAYVNNDMILAFNPTMITMFSNIQEMKGNTNSNTKIEVLVHEIEHMIQSASNDFNEENGIESGFCRKYENVKVNSLWNDWLLEGAAELKKSEDLNVEASTYHKKISYINSYDLSRFFDKNYNLGNLKSAAFTTDLKQAFDKLNISDANEQKELLNFLFSTEITQMDVKDFWQNYETKNNITLTDTEKNNIRMNIRSEVEKYLLKNYYIGLIGSINKGEIKDLETVFYFIRMFELDSFNHLNYTGSNLELQACEDFIKMQDSLQKQLFELISSDNNINYEDILNMYNDYNIKIICDGKDVNNYNLSNFSDDKQVFLEKLFDNYSTTKFSRNNAAYNYINIQKGMSSIS